MPFLTKSRYRLGFECPTKIHYGAYSKYHSTKSDDSFLQALAAGGFQVGELARHMVRGTLIATPNPALALAETARHLGHTNIVLHEAAFQSGNFLVRTDILAKMGNAVELIEVKSKGFNPMESMTVKSGLPNSTWAPYIHDIAFQTMVVRLAHPSWEVKPFLMLPNKAATAPVDGINGLFRCRRVENNYDVSVTGSIPPAVLTSNLLVKIDVSALVQKVLDHKYDGLSFEHRARFWATELAAERKIPSPIKASKCSKCEFRADAALRATGKHSGFHECWGPQTGLPDDELDGPLVLDIWKIGKKQKQKLIGAETYRLRDVDPDTDIPESKPKNPPTPGWLPSERQRIQIRALRDGNHTNPVVDRPGLRAALDGLKFPLHFIDFETTRAALPFRQSEHPYGNVAFQFSHHQIDPDGTIHHAHDWICLDRGSQPNEEFARALRQAIGNDSGTVLHYARHERTVLGDIVKQLAVAPATPERQPLVSWLNSLMPHRMVDMLEILVRHYYHPTTGGSNSLKAVLPAILSTSPFLREKYSRPVYGTPAMPSLRFSNFVWLPPGTTDPYTLLTPMEKTLSDEDSAEPDGVTNGGEAMIAYAKCQFTDITDAEVAVIRKDLLKYCELDTLAMVMLWETWTHDEVPRAGLHGKR